MPAILYRPQCIQSFYRIYLQQAYYDSSAIVHSGNDITLTAFSWGIPLMISSLVLSYVFPRAPWELTQWGRDKMDAVSQTTFSSAFYWMKIFGAFLWNCPQMNAAGPYWWPVKPVNTGSGNGLMPSGNKPLSQPMLTKFDHAVWHH